MEGRDVHSYCLAKDDRVESVDAKQLVACE